MLLYLLNFEKYVYVTIFLSFDIIFNVYQGFNARKVISEVYASFVLQCTVTGRYVNTRWTSKPDMGSIFHINN